MINAMNLAHEIDKFISDDYKNRTRILDTIIRLMTDYKETDITVGFDCIMGITEHCENVNIVNISLITDDIEIPRLEVGIETEFGAEYKYEFDIGTFEHLQTYNDILMSVVRCIEGSDFE